MSFFSAACLMTIFWLRFVTPGCYCHQRLCVLPSLPLPRKKKMKKQTKNADPDATMWTSKMSWLNETDVKSMLCNIQAKRKGEVWNALCWLQLRFVCLRVHSHRWLMWLLAPSTSIRASYFTISKDSHQSGVPHATCQLKTIYPVEQRI